MMRVVATDRRTVAAIIVKMAHRGRCAGTAVAGEGGGGGATVAPEIPGGGTFIAEAAGARPIATARALPAR